MEKTFPIIFITYMLAYRYVYYRNTKTNNNQRQQKKKLKTLQIKTNKER